MAKPYVLHMDNELGNTQDGHILTLSWLLNKIVHDRYM